MSVYLEKDVKLGENAFTAANSGEKITFYAPNGVSNVEKYIESSKSAIVYYSPVYYFNYEVVNGNEIAITSLSDSGLKAQKIVVPRYIEGKKVTTVGNGAFAHSANLLAVSMPEDLTTFGDYVFVGTFENIEQEEIQKAVQNGVLSGGDYQTVDGKLVLNEVTFRGTANKFQLNHSNGLNYVSSRYIDGVTSEISIYAVLATTTAKTFELTNIIKYIAPGAFAGAKSIEAFTGEVNNLFGYSLVSFSTYNGKSVYTTLVHSGTELHTVLSAAVNPNTPNELIIPSGVTTILPYAMYGYDNVDVTTLRFGNQLVEIGEGAFENAVNIKNFNIDPSSAIYRIEERTFYGCTSLEEMPLLNALKFIGRNAFGNSGLRTITNLPELLFTISDGAFIGCDRLEEITIPENVHTIGEYAFASCSSLSKIVIPESVTSIGKGAFRGTSISSITLPSSIDEIAEGLFEDADKLSEIIIKGNIVKIGARAFKGTTVLSVLPSALTDNLTELGEYAFADSGLNSISLGIGVKEIPAHCFENCKYLTEIKLSSAITKVHDYAFNGCNGLIEIADDEVISIKDGASEVTIADGENKITKYPITTQRNKNTYLVVGGLQIRVVAGKITVNDRTIPSVVTEIENETVITAIYDNLYIVYRAGVLSVTGAKNLNLSFGVTYVQFGINVTELGDYAFADCALTTALISDGIVKVGDYCFKGNEHLESVEIGGNLAFLGQGAFSGATSLTLINVSSRNTTFTNMGDGVLFERELSMGVYTGNVILKVYPAGLVPSGDDRLYKIPNNTVGIDSNAFEYSTLITVYVPSSVKTIGKNAFQGASDLVNIFFEGDIDINGEDIFNGILPNVYETEKGDFVCIDGEYVKFFEGFLEATDGGYAYVDGKFVAYTSELGEVIRYNKARFIVDNNGEYVSGDEETFVLDLAHSSSLRRYSIISDDLTTYALTNLVIDCPEGSNVYDYCQSKGYTCLPFGVDITSISTNGVICVQHTQTECFTYTESEYVTITGLSGTCGHASHETLVIPTYINAKEVRRIGEKAFVGTGIKTFALGRYVDTLGEGFLYDNEIEEIYIASIPNVNYDPNDEESSMYSKNSVFSIISENIDGYFYKALVGNVDGYNTLVLYTASSTMKEYRLPENITAIGYGAFANNNNLENVIFNDNITNIPDYAFANATALRGSDKVSTEDAGIETVYAKQGLYLGNNVSQIGEGAFENASALTALYAKNSELSIANKAFAGCSNLVDIAIATENESGINEYSHNFNDYYFDETNSILYVTKDEKLLLHTFLSSSALNNNTVVVLPESYNGITVEGVDSYAFYASTSDIMTVVIPYNPSNRAVSIGEYAFANSAIKTIHFEGDVYAIDVNKPIIDNGAFVYLPFGSALIENLRKFSIAYKEVSSRNDLRYASGADGKIEITGLADRVSSNKLVIPYYVEGKQVTSIREGAFDGNSIIEYVELFDMIKSLSNGAFKGCYNLNEVVLTETEIVTIPEECFANCSSLVTVKLPRTLKTIANGAFKQTALTKLPYSDSLETIGDEAFRDSKLESISLYTSIKSVGAFAFADNDGIRELSIPTSIQTIGEGAFSNCKSLLYVHFQGNVANLPDYNDTSLTPLFDCLDGIMVKVPSNATNVIQYLKGLGYKDSEYIVEHPEETQNLFLYTPSTCFEYEENEDSIVITGMKKDASHDYATCEYCKDRIYFPDEINGKPIVKVATSFKASVSSTVRSIEFNSALVEIEDSALRGLSSLESVVFGVRNRSNLTRIGKYAFVGTSLTSLAIPSSNIAEIDDYAFAGVALNSISLLSVERIGNYAFANTELGGEKGEEVIRVNEGSLANIDIMFNNNGSIGDYAFANNTALGATESNTFAINGNLINMGVGSFYNTNLSAINQNNFNLYSVETVGDYAFANTQIKFVASNARVIGNYAYARGLVVRLGSDVMSIPYADGLTTETSYDGNVTLSNVILGSVEEIGYGAFSGTSIVKLTVGEYLVDLKAPSVDVNGNNVLGAIENTPKLQSITVNGANKHYFTQNGALVEKTTESNNKIIAYPQDIRSLLPSLTNRELQLLGVEKDGDNYYITISNIKGWVTVGRRAFVGSSINAVLMDNFNCIAIEPYAFYNVITLEYVTMGAYVETIGDYAFANCTGLVDCLGGASCLNRHECNIRKQVYGVCSGYNAVNYGARLSNIGNYAFANCSGITHAPDKGLNMTIGANAYAGTSIKFMTVSAMYKSILAGAFNGVDVVQIISKNKDLTIANNAFKTTTKVYYPMALSEDEPDIASVLAKVESTKLAHWNWSHFVIEGNQIKKLSSICENHNNSHQGESIVLPRYSTLGEELSYDAAGFSGYTVSQIA